MSDAYAQAGVDTAASGGALRGLVDVLSAIDPGRPSRSLLGPGHFASVIEVADGLGVALCTDGVGTKLIVAQQAGRLETVGIDCVAMNVNDLICVGATPLALVDYIAVEQADPARLEALARGLRDGAEQAGIEIPGGELAQVPELIRGHPSPEGFDLVGTAIGTVPAQEIVTGAACAPGDALIGVPSSGLHSNGYTLARRVLVGDDPAALSERPAELEGASIADALLEPTAIYVRAALELLAGDVPVHGLAHITGDGVLNLLRLRADVGFEIDAPLPAPAIFDLIADRGRIAAAEMWEVFNMGCGLCAIVPRDRAPDATALLASHHPGARTIGLVSDRSGRVELPGLGLEGDRGGLRAA